MIFHACDLLDDEEGAVSAPPVSTSASPNSESSDENENQNNSDSDANSEAGNDDGDSSSDILVNYKTVTCQALEDKELILNSTNCYDNPSPNNSLTLIYRRTNFSHQDRLTSGLCAGHYLVADDDGEGNNTSVIVESSYEKVSEGKILYLVYYNSRNIAWYADGGAINSNMTNFEISCFLYAVENVHSGEFSYFPYDPYDSDADTESFAEKVSHYSDNGSDPADPSDDHPAYNEDEPCYIQVYPQTGWRSSGANFLPLKDPVGFAPDGFNWSDQLMSGGSKTIDDIWDKVGNYESIPVCQEDNFSSISSWGSSFSSSTYQIANAQIIINNILDKYIPMVRIEPEDVLEED